ncbi:protein disulfide-isomerase : Thiol:disulfide interchange protein-like protein OS=Planctomyces limnophilus (strain ATCC 43296 / DSM 3776 / IFAM 1008 / 290) GN=Plim_1636 PE=4 SV=1: Thioredoxin_7 [Gemmataceae bacterium]|nr:protein disulfide-isomerase : Thiol:disulfide interchange protein-like protein OS=Planctomyces limnophilus (strain ATCC 43296 / DSM 3776 / IFAM 1008 / 290) GN=Plim_1636 PE=4 SV=1: Thioredoxin_7 [Gemmataceae bacterium]VTT98133.1 protein disulfide-isomerase : Thiol:disulfide interchange protein-like protein OS=Planctomyces limnophilus (strain ATCC 43296 / DSM 3776 / IFAM 1008 / 290) GN=Plim_1636 PE=4 SV=1: Thioredoxin_7 [Gemmataceae bacterium]
MMRPHLCAPVAALVVFFAAQAPAGAQDVKWRHDYAAARREAAETGKPLLLDFGTEACVWCRKLDGTTFRDPKVARLLNDRFIPVKIDATKYEKLTSMLGIDGFPTLLLATPDGKVAGRHAGYADVSQLTALLGKAPAPNPPPSAGVVPASATTPAVPVPVPVVPAFPPPAPVRPAAPMVAEEPTADRLLRAREQIDADLAALHAKIATSLEK